MLTPRMDAVTWLGNEKTALDTNVQVKSLQYYPQNGILLLSFVIETALHTIVC